jgi:hypothetical protein
MDYEPDPSAPDEVEAQVAPETWQPVILVPEALTPLPQVDQALPVLGLFAGLLGRRHARYKVAVLRELAVQPRTRFKIREVHEAVHWMEQRSTTRLVRELRMAGLLLYDSGSESYRLGHEARVVATVCGALTVPEISYARIIKVFSSAIALARAVGAPEDAAYAAFLSAIAILEADREHLQHLIDDYSEQALLEAAELARVHVADMEDLLDEQKEAFARFQADPRFLGHDQRAHHVIAQLGRLAAEVVMLLSRRASEIMRGGLRFDRQDLRDLIATRDLDALAQLVADSTFLPAALATNDPVTAFAALDDYLGRAEQVPAAPPPPIRLRPQPPPDPGPSQVDVAARALGELALAGGAPLADWVVADTWTDAVGRMTCAVEAWSRDGPSGNGTLPADLDPQTRVTRLDRDGVAIMSETLVRPRMGRP